MLGAMIGDYVGSPYEFDFNNHKSTEFEFFGPRCHFTDDTVMTVAIAEALMESAESGKDLGYACVVSMRKWGRRYPNAGYGGRFAVWLAADEPKPYGSYGNGAAMRVSPVGWAFGTLDATLEAAEAVTCVTHNHPEGIKGAKAVATAIFLARMGASKNEIRDEISGRYGYDLSRTLDEIRPGYRHVESCQESVPEAITAFLESSSYEDAVRLAVSIGGDSDTIACIAGSIAEAYYGIPEYMKKHALAAMPADIAAVCRRWRDTCAVVRDFA